MDNPHCENGPMDPEETPQERDIRDVAEIHIKSWEARASGDMCTVGQCVNLLRDYSDEVKQKGMLHALRLRPDYAKRFTV